MQPALQRSMLRMEFWSPPGPMVAGRDRANIEKAWQASFDAGRTSDSLRHQKADKA